MRFCTQIGMICWLAGASILPAHFHTLIPQHYSVKKGESVEIVIRWGHPFESQWFDAQRPESVLIRTPRGKLIDSTANLKQHQISNRKPSRSFRFQYTPEDRGDHILLVRMPPVWLEEDEHFVQDFVKVVLHVQTQSGWDKPVRDEFEWTPLTRPYGIRADSVFQARLRAKPNDDQANAIVEIEKYNKNAPAKLPPDELITLVTKTDPRGIVTTSFPEGGWWSLTSSRKMGTRKHEGKDYPLVQRSTFWVYIHPRSKP